jgi:hypothetical protein
MPKTKKNVKYMQNKNMKIELDSSAPTYSDLNAFMRPSKISPMYLDNSHDEYESSSSSSD